MCSIWKLIFPGLLTLLLATQATADELEKIEPISSNVWSEAVVSVTDLDRTARFFTELGGYQKRWRGSMSKAELASFGLSDSASAEVLLLGHGDQQTGLVRLVRFDNAGRKEPMRPGSRAWDIGCYASLMVRAKNIHQLFDDAIKMGWWTETPITRLEFGASKLDVVIFKGPDGLQVQTYERLEPPLPEEVGEFDSLTRPFNVMQMVSDRDAAHDFFTKTLGFGSWYLGKPYVAKEPSHSPLGIPIGLSTSMRYQAGIVHPVPGEFGRMEMIDFMDFEGRDYSARCDAPNLGILSIRFPVDSMQRAITLMEERQWPVEQTVTKAEIVPYGTIEIFSVKTPDGALVSFFE